MLFDFGKKIRPVIGLAPNHDAVNVLQDLVDGLEEDIVTEARQFPDPDGKRAHDPAVARVLRVLEVPTRMSPALGMSNIVYSTTVFLILPCIHR